MLPFLGYVFGGGGLCVMVNAGGLIICVQTWGVSGPLVYLQMTAVT